MSGIDTTEFGFNSIQSRQDRFKENSLEQLDVLIKCRTSTIRSVNKIRQEATIRLVISIALCIFCFYTLPLWIQEIREWKAELRSSQDCLHTEKEALSRLTSYRIALSNDPRYLKHLFQGNMFGNIPFAQAYQKYSTESQDPHL